MAEYTKLQLKEIKIFARLSHLDDESAAMEWIRRGLAKKFAIRHRTEFGMIAER